MNQVLRAVSSSLNTRIHSSYLKQAPVTLKIVCFISNKPIRKKLSKMNPLTKTKTEKYFQPTANSKIKNEIIYEDEVRIKHRNRALEYSNSININIIKEQGKNVYEALIKKFSLRPVSRKTKSILRAPRKIQPNLGLSRPNALMLLPPKKTDKEINSRSLLATGNSMVKSEPKISEAIEDRSLRKNKIEQPNATNKEQQNRAKTTNINLYVLSKQKKAYKEDKLKSLNKSRPEIEYHIKKLSEKYNKIRRLNNALNFKANDAKDMNKNIIVKNQDNNIQAILQLEKKKRMAMEIMREVRTTNKEENHSTLMSFEQKNRQSSSLSKKKRELQEIIAELKKNKPYKTESKQHSMVMQSIESLDKNNSVRKQELTQNREDRTNSDGKPELTQNREDKNNSFRKQELTQNREDKKKSVRKQELTQNREDKNNSFKKQELTKNREDKNNAFRQQELTQNREDKNNSFRKQELTQNKEDKTISVRKQELTQNREDKNNSLRKQTLNQNMEGKTNSVRKQELTQNREDKNNSLRKQTLNQNMEGKTNSVRKQELTQNREDKNNSVKKQELTHNREDKNNSSSCLQKTAPTLIKTMLQDYSNQVDKYRSPNTNLLKTIEKTKEPNLNEQKLVKSKEQVDSQTEVSSQQPMIEFGGTAVRSAMDSESRPSAKYKTEKGTARLQPPVESEITRNQMPVFFSPASLLPSVLPPQLCTNETGKNLTKQVIAGSQSDLNPLQNLKLETRQEFNRSGEKMNNSSELQKTVPTMRKDYANIEETDKKFKKKVIAGSQSDLNPLLNLKLETRQELRNSTVGQQEFNRNRENTNNSNEFQKSGLPLRKPVCNNQIDKTTGPEINLMRVKEETNIPKMDLKITEPKTQEVPSSNEHNLSNQEHKTSFEEKSIMNLTWSEIHLITNTNDKAQIQSASKSIASLTKPSLKSEKISEQLTKPKMSESQVKENPGGKSKLEIFEDNINNTENKEPLKVEDSPLDTDLQKLQIMSNVQQKKTSFKVETTNGGKNAIGITRTNIHQDANNSKQGNTIIRMDSNPGKYKKKFNSDQNYVSELREHYGSEQETKSKKQEKESKAKNLRNEKSKTYIHAIKAQTKNIISKELSQETKPTVNDSQSGTESSQEQHLMQNKPKSCEKLRNIVKLSLKIPVNSWQDQNSKLIIKDSSKKSTNLISLLNSEVMKLHQNQLITKTGLLEPVVELIYDVYKNLDMNGQEELSRVCCALKEIIIRDNHNLSNAYCKRNILEAQLELNKKVLLIPAISFELKEILQKLEESKKFKSYFLYPIEDNIPNFSSVKKYLNRKLSRPYIYPIMNTISLSRTHTIIDSSHKFVTSHCQLDKHYVHLNKATEIEIMALTKSLSPKQDETIRTNYSNLKDENMNTETRRTERQDTLQNRVQLKTFTKQIVNPTLKTETVPKQKPNNSNKIKDRNNSKLNKALLSTNYSTYKLKNDKGIKNACRAVNNTNARGSDKTITAGKKLEIENSSESERNVKRKSFRQLTEEAKSSPEFRSKLLDIKIFSQKTEKSVTDIEVIKTSKESKTFQSQCMSYSTMNSSQGYTTDIFSNSSTFGEMRFREVEEVCNSDAILKYVHKFKSAPMLDAKEPPSGYSEMIESIRDSYRNAYLKFRELEKHLLQLEQKKIKYVEGEHENKSYKTSYNAMQDKNFSVKSKITLSKSSHFLKTENEDMGAGGDSIEILPTIKFPNPRRWLEEKKYPDIYETKERSFKELVEQFNKKQRKYNINKPVNKRQTKDKEEKQVDFYSEDGKRDQENIDNITQSKKGIFINKIPIQNKLQKIKENSTTVGEPLNDFLQYDDQEYDKLNQMNFRIQDEKDYVRGKSKQIGISKVGVLFKIGRSEDEISHEMPRSSLKTTRKATFQTVNDDQIREVTQKYIKTRRSARLRLLNTRHTKKRSPCKLESPKGRDRKAGASLAPGELIQHIKKEDFKQHNKTLSLKKDKPKEQSLTNSAVSLPSTLNFHKAILNCKIVQCQEKQEEITEGNPYATLNKNKILKSLESRRPPETFAAMALIGPKQPLPTFANLIYEMKRLHSPDNELDATNRKENIQENREEMSGTLNSAKLTKSNHRTNGDMPDENNITSQNIYNVIQPDDLSKKRGKLKMSEDNMKKLKTMMMKKEDNTPLVEIKNDPNTQKQETDKNDGKENTISPSNPPFIEYLIKSNDLTQTSRVLMGREPIKHKDGTDSDLSESRHKDLRIGENYFQKQNKKHIEKLECKFDKKDGSENTISLSNVPFIAYSIKSNDLTQTRQPKKHKNGPEPGHSENLHKDNNDLRTEENHLQKQNTNTQHRLKPELKLDKNDSSETTISPSNSLFIEYLIKSNDLTQTSRVLMGSEPKKHKDCTESDLSESTHKENSDLRTEENDFQKQNTNAHHRQTLELQLDKPSHNKSLDIKKENCKQESVSLQKDETKEQLFTSSAVPLPSTLNFHKSILNCKILQCHEKQQEITAEENPSATPKHKNLKKFRLNQSNIESLQDSYENNTKYLSEKQGGTIEKKLPQTKDKEIKYEEKSTTQRAIKKESTEKQKLPLKVDGEITNIGKVSSLPVETQLNEKLADKNMIRRLEGYWETEPVSSESKSKIEEAMETHTRGSIGENNMTDVKEEESREKHLATQKNLSDQRASVINTITQLANYQKPFNQQIADLNKEEEDYKRMVWKLERNREAELLSSETKGKTEEAKETQSSDSRRENDKTEVQEESHDKNIIRQKELSDQRASIINTITQLTNNTKSFNQQKADLNKEEEEYKRMVWRLERYREAKSLASESKGETVEACESMSSCSRGETNKNEEEKEESSEKNLAHQKDLSDQRASIINTITQQANYTKEIADGYREAELVSSETKGKTEEAKETESSGSRGENNKNEVQGEEIHEKNLVRKKELSDQRTSIINTITQLSNNTNSFIQQIADLNKEEEDYKRMVWRLERYREAKSVASESKGKTVEACESMSSGSRGETNKNEEELSEKNLAHQKDLSDQRASIINTITQLTNNRKSFNQKLTDLQKEEEDYKRMVWRLERYRTTKLIASESKGKTEEAKEAQSSDSRGENNKNEVQEEESHEKNIVHQKELSNQGAFITQLTNNTNSFNQQPHSSKSVRIMKSETDVSTNLQVQSPINVNNVNERTGITKLEPRNNPRNDLNRNITAAITDTTPKVAEYLQMDKDHHKKFSQPRGENLAHKLTHREDSYELQSKAHYVPLNIKTSNNGITNQNDSDKKNKVNANIELKHFDKKKYKQAVNEMKEQDAVQIQNNIVDNTKLDIMKFQISKYRRINKMLEGKTRAEIEATIRQKETKPKIKINKGNKFELKPRKHLPKNNDSLGRLLHHVTSNTSSPANLALRNLKMKQRESSVNISSESSKNNENNDNKSMLSYTKSKNRDLAIKKSPDLLNDVSENTSIPMKTINEFLPDQSDGFNFPEKKRTQYFSGKIRKSTRGKKSSGSEIAMPPRGGELNSLMGGVVSNLTRRLQGIPASMSRLIASSHHSRSKPSQAQSKSPPDTKETELNSWNSSNHTVESLQLKTPKQDKFEENVGIIFPKMKYKIRNYSASSSHHIQKEKLNKEIRKKRHFSYSDLLNKVYMKHANISQ